MKNIKINIHLLKILGVSIFINFVIINTVFLWYTPCINDSFVIERIGVLISQYANNQDILKGFETFPNSPCFLLTIHLLTNIDLLDSIFLPIIPITAIFFIFLFSKIFLKETYISFFVSIPVYFYVFGRFSHYYEYAIAELMFLCFIYSLYKFYNSKNQIFFILYLLFFIGVKFFGPPMEYWSFFIVFNLVIIAYIIHKIGFNKLPTPGLTALALIFVMLLAYNPKFYNQFLIRDIDFTYFITNLYDFIVNVFYPNSMHLQKSDFTVIPKSHPIKIYYLFAITIPIVIKICYDIYKKNVSSWICEKDIFYSLIIISIFLFDLTLYGSLGLINLRYIMLVYPIIGAYFLKQLPFISNNQFKIYVFILIFLAISSNFLTIQNETYPFLEDELKSDAIWIQENIEKNKSILMGHYVFTSLVGVSSEINKYKYDFKAVQYNSDRYRGVTNNSNEYPLDFNYMVLNLDSLSRPIRQGPPEWTFFEPFNETYYQINDNKKLNKIYNTENFEIFSAGTVIYG